MNLTLGELILALELMIDEDDDVIITYGFFNAHSYRGYYDELAFEPKIDVALKDMLNDAKSALGKTFTGWKGGNFTMDKDTDCWIAKQGSGGGLPITRNVVKMWMEDNG